MGMSGTAVAKEAATMVLTDDDFATIVRAIRRGRALYDNILKFVRFQLSTTIGAILTAFFAPLAGLPEPFTALAFTTFVLFQFFNVFNARSEIGTAFNARFFDNRMLWISLVGTLALQAVAVHWMSASQLFRTTGMAWADWGVAIGVASTVLLFEETRKLVVRALSGRQLGKVADAKGSAVPLRDP